MFLCQCSLDIHGLVLIFRSKSELADLLQALSSSNKHGNARRVRAVGAGHSWSAVAQSDEIQVSMSNFKVSASRGRGQKWLPHVRAQILQPILIP